MQLIIEKPGTFLSVHNGMFHVRNDEGERDIPVDKVSSIYLSKASAVSTEALMLAVENEIEVLLIDRKG
ncbi:MAG: CRISPR-associated endonuclease Cas1, partial [Bacteroidales bacterium]|nr:CRISPR-associated endonuclease Cas1 [Bacteroidales bacterium]